MTFGTTDFKCALVTGGGGGLGLAIAQHFHREGKKIIICGRTKSKLQEAVKTLDNAPYYVLDTGKIESIPEFIIKLTKEHPELDCLINNAGVQRPLSVKDMKADEFLEKADQEISINVRGPMHLAVGLLPHFRSKSGAVIMNVSSLLGFVPFSIINPVYNGTKAWVHFWSMNLRTQLEHAGDNIRVVEIAPPAVGTDLHREREDPDDNKKHKNPVSLSVEEFMEDFVSQLNEGKETIGAGPSIAVVDRWYKEFSGDYEKAAKKK
ncbi:short-chain dehydrogenase [Dissoconium aciculare CBS 342.82]|uniref:Short-chain dehydrogenase n=1 Tax=Dissoconium aciculare CBS 342.82 TaxID=1314786 RepID=A0A6J3MI48_9PEZI|nr:short-chain dehydrogenase [Dissoconium aciculare CBS 342.82]KAF1827573.1 short-chain dehydrogenase [Dissoconium aciculare CBS 342.82]